MSLEHDILVQSLQSAGLRAGDACVVHSSLRGIGILPDGPAGIIRAMQEVLTPAGALVMPSFCYDIEPLIDLRTMPGRTGVLTETFRQMPDVIRSAHPTHSVCAWGERAEELCAMHESVDPFAEDSPLGRIMECDGKVMLIGVGMIACSMVHVCEMHCDLPYLHIPTRPERRARVPFIAPDGRRLEARIKRFSGCSAAFGVLEGEMRHCDALLDGKIGAKRTMSFNAAALLEVTRNVLKKWPYALLCNYPGCDCCTRRREYLQSKSHSRRNRV